MTDNALNTILVVLASVTVLGGFIAWLTYIARGVGRIESHIETVTSGVAENKLRIDGHDEQLTDHSKQLQSLQPS